MNETVIVNSGESYVGHVVTECRLKAASGQYFSDQEINYCNEAGRMYRNEFIGIGVILAVLAIGIILFIRRK